MNVFLRIVRWFQHKPNEEPLNIAQPITHWNEAFPGIKRLLFNIVVLVSIAGNIYDLHFVGEYIDDYVRYINYAFIVLAITIFLLERLRVYRLACSTNVLIYAIVINILLSLNFNHPHFAEFYMRETIFLGIVLIVGGVINRNNVLIVGVIYFIHYLTALIVTHNKFMVDNAALMFTIIFSYVILIYYILKSFQFGYILQQKLSFQLNESNKVLDLKNKQIEESENKYRMLAENAGDFIAMYNNNAIFTYTSPAVKNILGYEPESLINKDALALVHKNDIQEVKKCIAKTIQGEDAVSCQYRTKTRNGEYIWVEAIMKKINSAESRYMSIIRDISIRKKAQIELEVANQTKDKFFSIIAHDLKSPMSQIYSSAHILSEKFNALNTGDKELLIKTLLNGSEKLSSLLDDLLLWSRSQMGKIIITPEKLDIKQIIEDCIALFQPALEAKKIGVAVHHSDSVSAFADINSVKTVIRNVLSNAIKFSHSNSIITFEIGKIESMIEIKITDNGIGISVDRIATLFEIDKSISTPGTHDETGTGLGMIICKELIEKNYGRLSVESEINKGTSFNILLPQAKLSVN